MQENTRFQFELGDADVTFDNVITIPGYNEENDNVESEESETLENENRTYFCSIPPHELDTFFENVYMYYYGRGYTSIVLDTCLSILKMCIMLGLMMFLLFWVDWKELLQCGKLDFDSSCGQRAFLKYGPSRHPIIFWVFCIGIVLYITVILYKGARLIRTTRQISKFYKHYLLIDDRDLCVDGISWQSIMEKLMDCNTQYHLFGDETQNPTAISTEYIMNRICRKDNYLCSMYQDNVFGTRSKSTEKTNQTGWISYLFSFQKHPFPFTLEYCLQQCITTNMFVPCGSVMILNRNTIGNPSILKRRFRIAAILHLVSSPIILLYLFIVRFFFGQLSTFYYRPSEMALRDWSRKAKWLFYKNNEPKHDFEQRLIDAKPIANQYMELFPSIVLSIVSKFTCVILGAFVSTMLLVGFLDDSLLVQTHIFDRNLMWYIGIFAAAITVCRNFRIDSSFYNKKMKWNEYGAVTCLDAQELLARISTCTNYFPSSWKGKSNTRTTSVPKHARKIMQEFSELYKLKIKIFMEEFFSIVSTPYLLWFVFPARAHRIVEYIQQSSVLHDCGHVCRTQEFYIKGNGLKSSSDIFGPDTYNQKNDQIQKDEQTESIPISIETDPILATPFSKMGEL